MSHLQPLYPLEWDGLHRLDDPGEWYACPIRRSHQAAVQYNMEFEFHLHNGHCTMLVKGINAVAPSHTVVPLQDRELLCLRSR